MKIAIIGSKGYIGMNLIEALHDKYVHGEEEVSVTGYDIKTEKNVLDVAIAEADVVYHVAGNPSVPESFEDPMQDAESHIATTLKVLMECKKARVIIAGTIGTKNPRSPHDVAKLAQEKYAQILHKNAVVIRMPNIYGGNPEGHGVIDRFVNQIALRVSGNGTQTRDFVHVKDACDALIRAIDLPKGVYEIGTGKQVAIIDLAKAINKKIRFTTDQQDEPKSAKANNTIEGWVATKDPIEYIKRFAVSEEDLND